MMKITKKTLGMRMENNRKEALQKGGLMVQSKKANGQWGTPKLVERFGNETNEDIINRLMTLNKKEFRIAE